jgi:hypothetical protein
MSAEPQLRPVEQLSKRERLIAGIRHLSEARQVLELLLEEELRETNQPRTDLPTQIDTDEAVRITGIKRRVLLRLTAGKPFRTDHTRKTKTFDRAGLLLWWRSSGRAQGRRKAG